MNPGIYWFLLCQIPQIGLGGQVTRIIAFNHYISRTTPLKLMAVRFMIIDIEWAVGMRASSFEIMRLPNSFYLGYTIGQSLGGYLLVQKPIFKHGEIRNYTICFIIALVVEVLAFIWVWLMIDNRVDRKRQMNLELKIKGTNGTDIKPKTDTNDKDRDIHPIRLLFDFGNLKSMIRTVIKKRPNRARMQILLIFLSITIYILSLTGIAR